MKNRIILFLIIFTAFVLRIWKINDFPAGLNADEAAIGYNAYSLLQTGKDEFGHSWPINFQSFNDFKPGVYFYLVLPFVKLLGLTELAVRLPSVILGTLTVFLVYLLVKKLFLNDFLADLAAFFLAVSPWHLHFSRGGWESNAALFFITAGVYFFLKALEKPKFLIHSSLFFILSMYTYHSARLISPLLVLSLAVCYGKIVFVKKDCKYLTIGIALGLLLLLPLAKSFLSKEGTSRFAGVGILADKGPLWRANELRGMHNDPNSIISKILHNQYFEYVLQFADNYLSHFNGIFLFISGDEIQRNKVPGMGQMYLVEIPFLFWGIYFLFKKRPPAGAFIFWWLLISPVASALTFQSPHAIRALNMVIPLEMISAYGLWNVIVFLRLRSGRALFHCLFVSLFVWNFSFYLHQYYVDYPKTYPAAWEYGFRQLVSYVKDNREKYDNIYVTDKYDQPYILFTFYLKYSPAEFQKEAKLTERDSFGFSTVEHFGKYYFGGIDLAKNKFDGKSLIIGTPEEIPESATIMSRIYFKDGKAEAFRIAEN